MIDPFDGPDLDVVRIMLITIDGPGGVGRSTTAQLLAKALDDRAIPRPHDDRAQPHRVGRAHPSGD
jgi:Mrp family chromosome partitioning ATPase